MSSVFSKIVSGEIPSFKVAESEHFYAFLDINPVVTGHTLVVPKKETDYIFDIDSEEYKSLFAFARDVAKGIKSAIPCKRVGIAVIGLEVPHAHIHLIPLNSESDLDFGRRVVRPDTETMKKTAEAIRLKIEL
jgi:histidine triad (HIT) family protein